MLLGAEAVQPEGIDVGEVSGRLHRAKPLLQLLVDEVHQGELEKRLIIQDRLFHHGVRGLTRLIHSGHDLVFPGAAANGIDRGFIRCCRRCRGFLRCGIRGGIGAKGGTGRRGDGGTSRRAVARGVARIIGRYGAVHDLLHPRPVRWLIDLIVVSR